MENNGIKRKDTTKGPPLRVLSLDGGGVRGYSMFIIIQEIMYRTFVEIEGRAPRRNEIPKPADHFDLIVGTGTGGLIALMLGRLRLDLETCKELYVRLTRMVFETDKTILGIPTHHTLFKASKLEDAIREAVREHTKSDDEGDDGTVSEIFGMLSGSGHSRSASRSSAARTPQRHVSNASVVSFSAKSPTAQFARPAYSGGGGDPNARLYDERENRTKTAVTAVFKGASSKNDVVMLRSYDSRRESAPEFDCKIWEAGRATCSIGLAFKPIRIGQTVFHDDGDGRFNPSPEVLDEAVVNEWPGREVGVFLSIGTGKRPKGSDVNKAEWYEGFLGSFAEAKRKLIAKIEGCERTHEYMKKEHLGKRGVNIENYYRLNVEVGVGEFGMNEWHRLADISTSTRMFLSRKSEQQMVHGASTKLAKIHRAKQRLSRLGEIPEITKTQPEFSSPLAVELPADIPEAWPKHNTPPSRGSYESGRDSLSMPNPGSPSPRSSYDRPLPRIPSMEELEVPARAPPPPVTALNTSGNRNSAPVTSPVVDPDPDRLVHQAPTPTQYRNASGADKIAIMSPDEQPKQAERIIDRQHYAQPARVEPPPLPPKTPLPEHQAVGGRRPPAGGSSPPPYPVDDGPPPRVNMARKPDYRGR